MALTCKRCMWFTHFCFCKIPPPAGKKGTYFVTANRPLWLPASKKKNAHICTFAFLRTSFVYTFTSRHMKQKWHHVFKFSFHSSCCSGWMFWWNILHTSSTTPLCCHRPPHPSCQPCNWLSLVPTAELLHSRSPVVERSPHPHNCSLPAHLPPQSEDSPLHSVPRLLFGSFLIYCPFPRTVLSPCIFLFST